MLTLAIWFLFCSIGMSDGPFRVSRGACLFLSALLLTVYINFPELQT